MRAIYKKNLCIALCGKTGCGKDSVKNFLVNHHDFRAYSFADPIRFMLHKALPNIDYHKNPKARQIMINIAEEPKKIAPKCWAYTLTERIANDAYPPLVVIPDLRFKVELNHLRDTITYEDFGGGYDLKLVNIVGDYDRHIEEIKKEMSEEDAALFDQLEKDPSNEEHLTFYFDYVIENRDSLYQLGINTIKMLESFS